MVVTSSRERSRPARRDDGRRARGRPWLRTLGVMLVWSGIVTIGFIPYALFATRSAAVHAQDILGEALVRTGSSSSAGTPLSGPTGHATRLVTLSSRPRVAWPSSVALGTALARLSIPAAGVKNDIVVEGDDELRLQEGPGHYPSTPLPGEPGNVAIAGHRTTWLRPFTDLQAVKPGDTVTLQVGALRYVYRATSEFAVLPTDVGIVRPLKGWWLALTTCNPPYSAAQRLVLRARLARVETIEAVAPKGLGATRVPSTVDVRVPAARQVFSATPWPVLVVWLAASLLGVAAASVLARRRRYAWFMVLPAVACCFEAYGAAVRLLPGSW